MSTSDVLNRYLFDDLHVRGELVQLEQSFQAIIANHNYPFGVSRLLGELVAVTCLLSATLKFEGEISVQLQGDGPVGYMAINGNHLQAMRGIARLLEKTDEHGLRALIGQGIMVITVRPTQGEPYQGVVALEQDNLAACLAHYFTQSDQIPTQIWLYSDENNTRVAGALVQLLPDSEDKEQQQHDFEHICQLTNTIKADEIFSLPATELLHRLYHQEKLRLFAPQEVSYVCGCSKEKCLTVISQMEPGEINAILTEQGEVSMTCDYCQTTYAFDEQQLAQFTDEVKH